MCFSEFLAENGKIDTIERDVERIEQAKINIKNVEVEDKINIYEDNLHSFHYLEMVFVVVGMKMAPVDSYL